VYYTPYLVRCDDNYLFLTFVSQNKNDYEIIIEQTEKKIKLETIPKLVDIGLTSEQIAEMLELPLHEVQEIVSY
jgi:hypothetical protein